MYRILPLLLLCVFSCKNDSKKNYTWKTMEVTATAYNSVPYQTNNNPHITAFGDSLKPGLKYIAVSRDLLAMGLKHNTPVTIEGLDGLYYVKDKMHHRWKKRIDIYMGLDIKAAKEWGRKKLQITYGIETMEESDK
jgi:3D (Asp-Asp-Asp) domain-containing protein